MLCIILTGCGNDKPVRFEKAEALEGVPVDGIEILSSGNVYITVQDTFLVVVKGDEPFINIFSTNSHKILSSFGKEGRGPNEFLGPSLIKTSSASTSKNVFFVHDYKRNKIARIDIEKVLKDSQNFEIRPMPETDSYLTFVHYIGDRFLIGTPSQGGLMTIVDLEIEKSKLVPYLPELKFDVPEYSLSTIFRPAVLVNEEKNRVAVAPLYLGEVSFFNFSGEYLNSTILERRDKYKDELVQGERFFSEIKEQIIEFESVDELIFALNSNTSVKNFRSGVRNNKVQVFDWSGAPVKEYLLDDRHIFSIGIDTLHKRIYGYDVGAETNNIIYYNY